MRKLVKLVLFYSLCLAVLYIASTGLRFLVLRVEWVRALSQEKEAVLVELISAARWALSLGVYGGVLLALSYTARKKVFAPGAILIIIAMTLGFTIGVDELLKSWERVPSAQAQTQPLGGPGLMLSNTIRPAGTVVILLEGPDKPGGKRVVATPGKTFVYQEELSGRDAALVSLPPAPFNDATPWLLKSLSIDLRLNSEIMRRMLGQGLLPFLIYAGALIFFLSSLLFIYKVSVWPLANLFLSCLAFRGVLAMEVFFNTPEMQETFKSFLEGRLPHTLAVPLIFCGIGLLAHLYSFLVYLAHRQGKYGNK